MNIRPVQLKFGAQSGSIMAEACIGLALMAFTWMLFTFVAYMGNNQIRTAMAARHAAWMMGNGIDPSADIPKYFFGEGDAGFVHVESSTFHLSMAEALTGSHRLDIGNWGADACLAKVRFGVDADKVKTTGYYPFSLLNTKVPFMPDTYIEGFSSVQSQCAWPGNVDNTWHDKVQAFKGILSMLWNEATGALGAVGNLVSKFVGSLFS